MKKIKLDLANWNRISHYEFFSQLEEPFYGVTVNVDSTKAFTSARELGIPFFTYYMHKTLAAVNAIENFKYRIIDNEVFIYDRIDASATIMRQDKTFGFSLIEFESDLNLFHQQAKLEMERIQNTQGLFTRDFPETNLIHFSAIPWVNFTSLSHARSFTYPDSCPKISFGKLIDTEGTKMMSMSVHVHHGLVDGYHVGLFVDEVQKQMNS